MATLLLSAAGGALGGALLGPAGAIAGRVIGALGGAIIDRALFSTPSRTVGPRLTDLDVMSSTEGASIARLYGRARLSGQVIWATDFEEVVSTETQSSGGKGGVLSASSATTYSYFGNFAVGLCEGPISRIARVWADGKLLDLQGLMVRTYLGGEDQLPDPLIAAKQGEEGTPAYRGLAYIVFERLALADFGNRLPQLMVEVERAVGELEKRVTAVTLIPGATEFGYDTRELKRVEGPGSYAAENRQTTLADSNIEASLDHLVSVCPALTKVALVVSWFGTDLRAGDCAVRPGVDRATKGTLAAGAAAEWSAAGVGRTGAHLVSQHEGRPAYGGTPSDESVRRAILALKARGMEVTLYPFLMMDVPPGNGLPDPWGGAEQPAYPWRGRITCHPAPGLPGSPDGTATAAMQIAALFGTAAPGDFHAAGSLVSYSGPAEWTLRRMVLHYAKLASLAGGVDALLIGSEMAALTRVRSGPGVYPAASALAALAADVKSIVGAGTLVSYAADWTEYGAHVPLADGSELRFPLDPLWAAPSIDFVGIDWYPPLSDWRDGDGHLDAAATPTIYEPAYLRGNVRGGEGFDWYYADDAARATQTRLPITDGAHGEPWVFRQKDLAGWWANAHHERAGGVRVSEPTDWVPGAKPIRLMEVGCAAVDKGANRPSSFPDPKSSETGFPPFSNRRRDDLMQRRHLEATLDAFALDAVNPPAAGLPGGRMVDVGAIHLWSWDARPFPAFPIAADVWADGANWETGHWLTGRFGSAPLAELAATLCGDFGIEGVSTAGLRGVIDGYVVDRPMSARAALEPLARAFAFDLAEQDATLTLRMRGGRPVATLTDDDLARRQDEPELRRVRGAESELPRQVSIGFLDAMADYRRATAASRRLVGAARTEAGSDLAMVTCDAVAEAAAETWLQDAWAGRDTLSFALAPSRLAIEPGDVVTLVRDGRSDLIEILAIEDTEQRAVSARSIDPNVFTVAARAPRAGQVTVPPAYGPPEAMLLALPALESTEPARLAYLAAFVAPWPGALGVWRAVDGASFERIATLAAPSVLGETLNALEPAPVWRFDRGAVLEVKLHGGLLAAASEAAVLDGANGLALVAPDGGVEVVQFAEAELTGPLSWRLAGLLRGQLGTERFADATWPAGTRVVRLDRNLAVAAQGIDLLGRPLVLRIGRADRDHGDPDVTEIAGTVSGLALTPLAPVRAQARRGPDGVALSWVRRARLNADSWEAVEIPLGEEREAYRVDILDGAAVVRTVEVSAPGWLYASADEVADFGAPQAALSVRIAQLSATVGAGQALEVVLMVG